MKYWNITIYGIIFICCLTLMTIAFFNTYNVFGAKRDIKNIQIKNSKGISTPKVTTGEIYGKDNILNVMGELSTTGKINSSTIDSINNNIGLLDNNVKAANEITNEKLTELNRSVFTNKEDADKKIKVLNNNQNEMKKQIHRLEISLVSSNKKISTLESRLVRLGTALEAYDIAHSNHTYFNHI